MGDKRAVIVVHGVGDQTPGCNVEEFATNYTQHTGGIVQAERGVLWLKEPDAKGSKDSDRFPCHLIRSENNDDKLIFAEVYWADLSRVAAGTMGVLRGVFDIVFGLPHLIRQATEAKGLNSQESVLAVAWLRRISAAIMVLLRGPIIALNILLAVAAIAFVLFTLAFPNWLDHQLDLQVIVFSVLTGSVTWVVLDHLQTRLWSPIAAFWLLGSSTIIGIVALFHYLFGSEALTVWWYGGIIIYVLNLLWWVIGTLSLPLVAFWWMARRRVPVPRRPGIDIAFICTTISAAMWGLVVSTLWILAINSTDVFKKDEILKSQSDHLLNSALELLGFLWLWALGLILIILIVWFLRWTWKKQYSSGVFDPKKRVPRLIVPKTLWLYFLVTSLAWFALEQLVVLKNCGSPDGIFCLFADKIVGHQLANKLLELLASSYRMSLMATLIIGGFAGLVSRPLRAGLDIGLDVINYFRTPGTPVKNGTFEYAMSEFRKMRDTMTKNPSVPLDYTRRNRMNERFVMVLDAVMRQASPSQVTIVTHSQGSMVAIGAMNLSEVQKILPGSKNQLITMGSPYGHLYRYYFPEQHPDLQNPPFGKIDKWINVFRTNDFVGTDIVAHNGWPTNLSVEPRGHTDYWSDKQVLDHIAKNAPL